MTTVAEAEAQLADAREAVLAAVRRVADDVKSNWGTWANDRVRSVVSSQPEQTEKLGSAGLSRLKASIQQSATATLGQVSDILSSELAPEKWSRSSSNTRRDLERVLERLTANLWQIVVDAGYKHSGLDHSIPPRPGFGVKATDVVSSESLSDLSRAVRDFDSATSALDYTKLEAAKESAADAWDQA